MVDLTNIITGPGHEIDVWYEKNQTSRTWLGLSEIGHPCLRYLWYAHRGYPRPPLDGRTLRLFELGNVLEDVIVKDLGHAGYRVHSQQKEVVIEDGDVRLTGHIDGIIERVTTEPHLLEIKTAGEKSFAALKKYGSYERWNPRYKGQVQIYMALLKLKRCLVVVYNKNTSELYTERIKSDMDYVSGRLVDVFSALRRNVPPDRTCPRADWFEAKFCGFYGECFL